MRDIAKLNAMLKKISGVCFGTSNSTRPLHEYFVSEL
jgi:hypothetical protein